MAFEASWKKVDVDLISMPGC